MGKTKDLLEKQHFTGSTHNGDEDYLYEQYLAQEKLNEEYWQWRSVKDEENKFSDDVHHDKPHSIFPDGMEYDDEYYKSTYIPTKEEEDENYIKNKNNGHTT